MLFLIVPYINCLAQEDFRMLKSTYFIESPNFQKYVATNKLKQETSTEKKITRTVTYDASGEILQEIYTSKFGAITRTDEKLGKVSISGPSGMCITPLATKPSVIPLDNGDYYVGYLHVGTYYSHLGFNFTGFMLPILKEYGNGSVLFMEDVSKGEYYWATIVDGVVESKIPATKDQKPDVQALKNSYDFEAMYLEELPKGHKIDAQRKEPIMSEFTKEYGLYTIRSKTPALNGYGISMVYSTHQYLGEYITVNVGMFKEGSLNGTGYFIQLLNKFGGSNTENHAYMVHKQGVYALFGEFANNNLIKGRTINVNPMVKNRDFWSKKPYDGIVYTAYQKNGETLVTKEDDISIYEINDPFKFYIPSVDREVDGIVNKEKGIIEYSGDAVLNKDKDSNIRKTIDGTMETYYYKEERQSQYNESCPRQSKVAIYEDYTIDIKGQDVAYDRRVVKGVYYDKVITTTTTTPTVLSTIKGTRFTGRYDYKTCPICNGSGSIPRTSKNYFYRAITFKKTDAKEKMAVVQKEELNASNKCISGNCSEGFGELKTAVSTITGFFAAGKANGYGKEVFADGSGYYQGKFESGLRGGYGLYVWNKTQEQYIGEWKNGKQNGYGYYIKGDEVVEAGFYYEGKQMRNMLTENFISKKSVENCTGNCSNGFGIYRYDNKDSYLGFFRNGKRDYIGKYTWAEGDWYIGEMLLGELSGQAVRYYHRTGTMYRGHMSNAIRYGYGANFNKEGAMENKGLWENGVLKKPIVSNNSVEPVTNSSKEAGDFISVYSTNISNLKQHLKQLEDSWEQQKYPINVKTKKYADLIEEIYESDKDAAFEFTMKMSSNVDIRGLMPLLKQEIRDYIKDKARKKVQTYSDAKY